LSLLHDLRLKRRVDVTRDVDLDRADLGLNRYGFSAASFRVREDGVMPKKIDPAVKERAVRLVREHRSEYPSLTAAAEAVARQERLGKETVRRWAVQAEVDAGDRPGVRSEENAEIKALKAKVRRLEEDNAILKAASVFFAGELDPRNR
jgi:transposase-like protein